METLPFGSPEADYERQAEALRTNGTDVEDPRLALARWYGFRDWSSLLEWLEPAVRSSRLGDGALRESGRGGRSGDRPRSLDLLADQPDLVRARSTIVTPHEPALHRATLLHYVAANGVEGWRQRTPPNAVEIATLLLKAGAEPDARANMYGGQHTTMTMLVSSAHPAAAGLQAMLAETLLDFGASVDGSGPGTLASPLMTSLAYGYLDHRRGSGPSRRQHGSPGGGRRPGLLDDARRLLKTADAETRHRATALAAQHGQNAVLRLLLDAGEDPNRLNPRGFHGHSTPLHQAVWSNHLDTVQLLVDRGARLDIPDTMWHGTPLGWAEFGKRDTIVAWLRTARAT